MCSSFASAVPILTLLIVACANASCVSSSGGVFLRCRQSLIQSVFGQSTLPSRAPDFVFAGSNALSNNQTQFIWTITDNNAPNGVNPPSLNATVFLSLNSSGHAMPNYAMGPPRKGGAYRWPHWPSGRQKTLLFYHNGHETESSASNYDGVVYYFNELGFDVAEFDMPLYGFNKVANISSDHSYFEPWVTH
jgi:hypothetical protein